MAKIEIPLKKRHTEAQELLAAMIKSTKLEEVEELEPDQITAAMMTIQPKFLALIADRLTDVADKLEELKEKSNAT